MLITIFLVATGIKLILIPAYISTDFEVHRNWLAITYSLPLNKWYVDNTSEWTLDYPPLFAWFQYALSNIARYFDENMLIVSNTNYLSYSTLLFMRISVILSDFILMIGCKVITDFLLKNPVRKSSKWKLMWGSPSTVFSVLVLCNVGLILIDHIHFQYNGILYGILLISIGNILKGNYKFGAFWFAVLLNMKHIFLYMAPAYIVYLLRNYCMMDRNTNLDREIFIRRLRYMAAIVIFVTTVSFGPFIYEGQLGQVLGRLFPFKRGLCHTYWAPNFWAIYNAVDKLLIRGILLANNHGYLRDSSYFNISGLNYRGQMTSGLLQNQQHLILPTITPAISGVLVLLSILPCLVKLWYNPGNPLHFLRSIIICTLCAFMFGWHVHEKAILMAIIPMSVMAVFLEKEAETYSLVSITGYYSLLPLIYTSPELPFKIVLMLLHGIYISTALSDMFHANKTGFVKIVGVKGNIYILGLVIIFLYQHFFQRLFNFNIKYPFMPLLLTSTYCAIGITACSIKYYLNFLTMCKLNHKQKIF